MTHPPRPATSSCAPVSGQEYAPAPAGAKNPASRRAGSGRAAKAGLVHRNAGETHALFIPAVTRLEAEALAYLGWHIKEHRRPPGRTAMAEYLEITGLALGDVIRSLARKGLIYRPPERPDSLELTRPIQ